MSEYAICGYCLQRMGAVKELEQRLAKLEVLLRDLIDCEDVSIYPSAIEIGGPSYPDLQDWEKRVRQAMEGEE